MCPANSLCWKLEVQGKSGKVEPSKRCLGLSGSDLMGGLMLVVKRLEAGSSLPFSPSPPLPSPSPLCCGMIQLSGKELRAPLPSRAFRVVDTSHIVTRRMGLGGFRAGIDLGRDIQACMQERMLVAPEFSISKTHIDNLSCRSI